MFDNFLYLFVLYWNVNVLLHLQIHHYTFPDDFDYWSACSLSSPTKLLMQRINVQLIIDDDSPSSIRLKVGKTLQCL